MANNLKGYNFKKHLKKNFFELFRHSYLALLGVGEAVSFHFLGEKYFHLLEANALDSHEIILSICTILIFIHTWNEYFIALSLFEWTPTLIDAIIPFSIFIVQLFLAKNIDNPEVWTMAFCCFNLVSFFGFFNMRHQSKKYIINNEVIEHSKKRYQKVNAILIILLFLTLGLYFFMQYSSPNISAFLKKYSSFYFLFIMLTYSSDAILFWKKEIDGIL